MDRSSSPRRRRDGDQPPRRDRYFPSEILDRTSSNLQQSPDRKTLSSLRSIDVGGNGFDISYGKEPVPVDTGTWDTPYATTSYDTRNISPRTASRLSSDYVADRITDERPAFVEGIENDGRKAEEVEEAGLSWTVTLPMNNEQSMFYTDLTDANSVWKVEKSYDRKIGTTKLQSIYSIKYSIGEMGQGKVTLFCPQGPIRDDEDSALVQAKWLHVQRSSMSVKVLEKLVMDCPIINADIRRVAILLLESVEQSFLRASENGAYIEPGSVLRYAGTRHTPHDSHSFVTTEPIVFVAFPFVELTSSRNSLGYRESDEYYPRTLLQNLYGFDIVTSRGKHQIIPKMLVGSQPNDTLIVNQLWCLVIGSDILITMSDRPADDLLGDMIEKRTDYFRQPLRIEVVDTNGFQHSMSISSKTPWVDFFRHVIFTVHGNIIGIMDYELVDQAGEVITTERWVELAKATRPTLLKFDLVERKVPTSRSSSVSSRRSSRSGIKRLLLLDYAHRDHHHGSKANISRHNNEKDDGDSSSSERIAVSKRASTPRWSRFPRSSNDAQRNSQPTEKKYQQPGAQADSHSETDTTSFYPQSTPKIITLDSSDENYPVVERIPPSLRDSRGFDDSSENAKDTHKFDVSLHNVSTLPEQRQPLSPGDAYGDSWHRESSTKRDHNPMHNKQPLASNTEEKREDTRRLEDNFSYIQDDDETDISKDKASNVPLTKYMISSDGGHSIQMSHDALSEHGQTSEAQLKRPATAYQKVQIQDASESSEEEDPDRHAYIDPNRVTVPYSTTKLSLDGNSNFKGREDISHPAISPKLANREDAEEKRYILRHKASFPQEASHRRFHSLSRSLSTSTDGSLHSRGRSRTRRRRAWSQNSLGVSNSSPSRHAVRFHPPMRHSSIKHSPEMSPYGSSDATKVDPLPVHTAVPFFFWKQTSMTGAFSSQDNPEQILIKLLDQIDERISDDPVSKYYSNVSELTMDDVLSRHEAIHEAGVKKDSNIGREMEISGQMNILGVQETTDLPNSSPGQLLTAEIDSIQAQPSDLVRHDKVLAKRLIGMSQKVVWSFIPNTGGSRIHTLMKRFWGCVDIMCLQLLWEESQREHNSKCTYIIRNFSNQVKKTHLQRRKPTLGKIHYLACGDCKASKLYQSATDALDHLHEKHIDCQHSNSERPYDDSCYVWLRRIWDDGYTLRNSRDGLLGIVEDFIEELSYIGNYVKELHNMTARDSSVGDAASTTPPLSTNITHSFQQIVKMFVFRSKQLSLVNRRRSLVDGSSLENFPQIQRIDRKIDELLSLEMDTNERIIDLLENAKKDIFLSDIGSHSEMVEAETVRVQLLALAFMSSIQRPLLQPSFMGRSYVKDILLQLYKDYTSRLHFQANNRPRKRVFLDIHGLEEELQALDKLVDSLESCLYNVLTLIDPLTSRYTTETRIREFRAEIQYGNVQLQQLIERRREIDNLATRLWILKDQVKQTIEIMEEDHGKAIRVFTVVTLFFLPLSFVSSFLGMNTIDVRDSEWSQRIFWMTGIPITVAVLSLAFFYSYKGEELRDWILQDRDRRHSSSALHDMNGRTSLEGRRKEWNPATGEQDTSMGRAFGFPIRIKIKNPTWWKRNSKGNSRAPEVPSERLSVRRRNTEDSLAPMRRS